MTNHPAFGAFYAIIDIFYIALHFLIGFALCFASVWVIWRRFRIDRLNGWHLLSGFLLYAVAGFVVWHGFIVLQKVVTGE